MAFVDYGMGDILVLTYPAIVFIYPLSKYRFADIPQTGKTSKQHQYHREDYGGNNAGNGKAQTADGTSKGIHFHGP